MSVNPVEPWRLVLPEFVSFTPLRMQETWGKVPVVILSKGSFLVLYFSDPSWMEVM